MTTLTIAVLKELIENMPDDFIVEYSNETTVAPLDDKVQIDIGGKKLIFSL